MFKQRDIVFWWENIFRCLEAPHRTQHSIEAMESVRYMFRKAAEQYDDHDVAEDQGQSTDDRRFTNGRGDIIDDEQWIRETVSSVTALLRVLSIHEVTINVLGLLELLAKRIQDKAAPDTRSMYLDLVSYDEIESGGRCQGRISAKIKKAYLDDVEYEFMLKYDVAVLKGMDLCPPSA